MKPELIKRRITVCTFLALLQLGSAFSQQSSRAAVPPQVEILGTQFLKIISAASSQEYHLYVNLPRGYQDTTKTFPVIFLLDAQWDFPLAQAIFGEQYYDGFVPAAIMVGITWGGVNPNYDSLRMRDLTPTNIKQIPHSGNGPKFLSFLKQELIPFIESRYRTARNERTLMGSSLGGLFTLYALFHETGLFNRYVLTSPSLQWDNGITYAYEKSYAEKHSNLPVRLFIGVGELEGGGVTQCQKFFTQLRERNYQGLKLSTKVIEGSGHSGGKAEGYSRGLQAVFARPSVSLASVVLDQYVGKYQIAPGVLFDLVKEDGKLVAIVPGGMKFVLNAENENDFYIRGGYLFIRFRKNGSGKVTGFEMEQFDGKQLVKRID